MDIVIPLGPNDPDILNVVQHCKSNLIYRNLYIITRLSVDVPGAIIIDETIFPFKINQIKCKEGRNGWYFQQLLKLYAGFIIPGILDDYLVIDADTYFQKPVSFIDNGVYLFNVGTEYHSPYFEHMKKLHFTLTRQLNYSGICHHMIFNKKFVQGLFDLVSAYHNGRHFWEVFLDCISVNENSGSAEYEIYFNYMLIYHSEFIKIRPLKWENTGTYFNSNHNDYISVHWYMRH